MSTGFLIAAIIALVFAIGGNYAYRAGESYRNGGSILSVLAVLVLFFMAIHVIHF